jgi:hypothetical protein
VRCGVDERDCVRTLVLRTRSSWPESAPPGPLIVDPTFFSRKWAGLSGLSRSRRHAEQRNRRVHSYQAAARPPRWRLFMTLAWRTKLSARTGTAIAPRPQSGPPSPGILRHGLDVVVVQFGSAGSQPLYEVCPTDGIRVTDSGVPPRLGRLPMADHGQSRA